MNKLLAICGLLVVTVLAQAHAQTRTLKLQTGSRDSDWEYRFLTEDWQGRFNTITGGELKLEILRARSIVPQREVIDAVANGILDGDMSEIAKYSARDPAFSIIGDLIAGYETPDQLQAFCMHGGGKEILQKLYDEQTDGKVHVVGCGPVNQEAFVGAVAVTGVDDFAGLKIRSMDGLAFEVFKRTAATPVSLPYADVYSALLKEQIDAADASNYFENNANGMHQIAKYPVYPGIHSIPVMQFIVNGETWQSIGPARQVALETWYLAVSNSMRQTAELRDKTLVAQHKADDEINVISWSQEERDRFRGLAKPAWEAFASDSAIAKEALDVHYRYMREIGLLAPE